MEEHFKINTQNNQIVSPEIPLLQPFCPPSNKLVKQHFIPAILFKKYNIDRSQYAN